MVDIERLAKVRDELGDSIPSDILEAKEILKQKESIINQAQMESRRVKEAGEQEAMSVTAASKQEHESRVDETEIVKTAQAKAEQINQNALQEAQQIVQDAQRRSYQLIDEAEKAGALRREGANQYARETLFDLEERLAQQLGQVRKGIDALGLEVDVKVPTEKVAA